MVGIFRNYNPFGIIFLFFYGLVLRFAAFAKPVIPEPDAGDGFLYHELISFLMPVGRAMPVLFPILAYILIFIQALMLNGLVNNHRLLPRSSFLPAMAYILLTALFPEWWTFSSGLLANTLLVWIWTALTGLYNNPRSRWTLMSCGLALGISSLIYFPSIAFVLPMVIALGVMRPFRLAEWMVFLFGLTIPYYFLFAWFFLQSSWDLSMFVPKLGIQYPTFVDFAWAWGGMFMLVIPFLISGFYIQGNMLRMLIQVRKGWSILLLYLLSALLIPFINHTPSFAYWIMCAPPFAAFHANTYFHPQKKWIPALIHWIIVAFVLGLNWWMLTR